MQRPSLWTNLKQRISMMISNVFLTWWQSTQWKGKTDTSGAVVKFEKLFILDLWNIVCCVFWPAFRCCPDMKASWNTFWGPFQEILFFSAIFLLFLEKRWKNVQKKFISRLLKSWSKHKHWSTFNFAHFQE